MSRYYNPVKLIFDNLKGEKLKTLLTEINFENLLIVTWNEFVVDELLNLKSITNKNVKVVEFKISNPDIENLLEISRELEGYDYDLIIGLGGGSVLDVAKSLIAVKNVNFNNKENVREFIVSEKYKKSIDNIPLIAIPTTSGTGSEVTSWGTIWDSELTKKYSLTDDKLYAEHAIIIPELTIDLPLVTTISTALDALSHATEAYWSRHSNPVSQALSLQSIEKIIKELTNDNLDLTSLETRENLAIGSLLAGLSFSNTRTTACHAISYPLTMKYNIPHGIAVSMTLGKMMEINSQEIFELNRLLQAFNAESVLDVQRKIETIYMKFDIKYNLSDYNVLETDIQPLVEQSFTKGRIDNNPVDLSAKQIEEVLRSII